MDTFSVVLALCGSEECLTEFCLVAGCAFAQFISQEAAQKCLAAASPEAEVRRVCSSPMLGDLTLAPSFIITNKMKT